MSVGTKKNALDLFSDMSEVNSEKILEEKPATEQVNEVKVEKAREERSAKFTLKKTPEKSMRSHSLYFDSEIYEKLEKLSERYNMSVSKVLDEILRQVL